ncbi:hypothetical protein COLU111180_18585 [Cohnella lubricantis]|nr:hypothetical protein [Cohnella lubricantis]
MATMVPDLLPEHNANDGGRVFYMAARELPYRIHGFFIHAAITKCLKRRRSGKHFIILHRLAGFVAED